METQEYIDAKCSQCEALVINGIFCHETGCPNSHLNIHGEPYPVECKWCGQEFTPEDKDQAFCDSECAESFHG